MEEKYPSFPHCSSQANKLWEEELMQKPQSTLKELIHPVSESIRSHCPYFVIVKRNDNKAVFFNRQYEPIYEIKSASQKQCEFELQSIPKRPYTFEAIKDYQGSTYFFYNDRTNPEEDEKAWMKYWIDVYDFCCQLTSVPAFIRYNTWSIRELYVLASKVIKLERENKVLKQFKDAYKQKKTKV